MSSKALEHKRKRLMSLSRTFSQQIRGSKSEKLLEVERTVIGRDSTKDNRDRKTRSPGQVAQLFRVILKAKLAGSIPGQST